MMMETPRNKSPEKRPKGKGGRASSMKDKHGKGKHATFTPRLVDGMSP